MIEALKEAFPMAMGLALSPFPVIAVIMILMTPRAKRNISGFILGWYSGIYVIGCLIYLIPGLESKQGEPTVLSGVLRILAGLILLIFALRLWLQWSRKNDQVTTPKIFEKMDTLDFWKSFAIGPLFSVANVKNMAFSAAGASRLNMSLSDHAEFFISLALFALTASLTLIFPVVIYFLMGNKIEHRFLNWKKWLIKNNKVLLMLILTFISVILIKAGIGILLH